MTNADKKRIDMVREMIANGLNVGDEAFLLNKLDEAYEELRSVRDNYDCDESAHKYGTSCRCCEAAKIIGEKV